MSTIADVLRSKGSSSVVSIPSEASVYDAVALMAGNNVGSLLVTSKDTIVGILTERDYSRKIVLMNRNSRETKVSQIMNSDVLYVCPEDTTDDCMALMTKFRVRHFPVLSNGELLGLVSIGDIVKVMVSEREFLIEQLTRYITGSPQIDTETLFSPKKCQSTVPRVVDSSETLKSPQN